MLRMCGQSCQTPALKSYELIFKKKTKQPTKPTNKKGDGFALFWKVHEHQALSVHLGLSFVSYECWLNACWFKAPFWGGNRRVPCSCPCQGTSCSAALSSCGLEGLVGKPTKWPRLQAG